MLNGLSDDQWRSIIALLNAGKNNISTEKLSGTISSPLWIMDTKASHHLTGRYDILRDVPEMAPILIILADGRERVSNKEGTLYLGSNLVLRSVFFVEDFQSDLISVGQLMDENHCVVQLADHCLVVQDRTTRMVIGARRRGGGTFYLQLRSCRICCSA